MTRKPDLVRSADISRTLRLESAFLIAIGLSKIRSENCACGGVLRPYGICSMRFPVKHFLSWDVGLDGLLERLCVRPVGSAQSQPRRLDIRTRTSWHPRFPG